MVNTIRGVRGYAKSVAELIERYESLPFTYQHEAVLHLIPALARGSSDQGRLPLRDPRLEALGYEVIGINMRKSLCWAHKDRGKRRHAAVSDKRESLDNRSIMPNGFHYSAYGPVGVQLSNR